MPEAIEIVGFILWVSDFLMFLFYIYMYICSRDINYYAAEYVTDCGAEELE